MFRLRKFWLFSWPLLLTIVISMVFITLVNFNIKDYRFITSLFFVFYFLLGIIFQLITNRTKFKTFIYLGMPLIILTIYGLIVNPSLFPLYIPVNPLAGLAGIMTAILLKKTSRLYALLFGSLSLLIISLYCFWALPIIIQRNERKSLKVLESVPLNFINSLVRLDKTPITAQILSNKKVVLLDFWFIGCDPCMRKMEYLQKIHESYKDNSDVLIAVVSNGYSDKIEEINDFKQKHPEYTFEFLYDSGGEFCKANNFTSFPVEIILNSSQNVVSTYHGFGRETENLYINKTKQAIEKVLKSSVAFK